MLQVVGLCATIITLGISSIVTLLCMMLTFTVAIVVAVVLVSDNYPHCSRFDYMCCVIMIRICRVRTLLIHDQRIIITVALHMFN